MNFIIWIVIGGVLGWLASLVMKTDAQQGMFLNVVVGIVGALPGRLAAVAAIRGRHHQYGRFQRAVAGGVIPRSGDPAGDREPYLPRTCQIEQLSSSQASAAALAFFVLRNVPLPAALPWLNLR